MQHPARKISLVTALIFALSACGGDKTPEKAPEPTKVETAPAATAEVPAENKAEVTQEPIKEPAKEAELAQPEPVAEAPTQTAAAPVEALSIEEGKKRYEQTCKVCHDQGLLDAPKLSDKAEWAKRLEKGVDKLHEHSAKGFNKMPAQAVGAVTEAEVYAAVDYMLEQAK
ncbi:c-type cytochrome [Moraxella bovoculi]|uniref:c-type cytochrome n=1 Tax=Moraxella bovoculi TaxID=386891 RepID=UPI00062447B7|nr:c-type cytochrome [Moraxella bovoculi]